MDTGKDAPRAKPLSRHILKQIVATVAEGVLVVDACDSELKVVFANPAYEQQSGFSAAELEGAPWQLLQRDTERSPELAKLRQAIGHGESGEAHVLDIRKDGSTWFSRVELSPLLGTRGDLRYFLCRQRPLAGESGHNSNVEVDLLQRELGHARQRIASLSRTDPVTGLANYEHFISLLGRDLGVARRDGRCVSVLAFEIVEIDVYRETFGSNAADSCLRMIGAQVAGAFRRAGDLCARRGESILVVATLGQDQAAVESLAARVADKVRGLGLHNPRGRTGRHLAVRSSAVSLVPTNQDAESIVEGCCADLADAEKARRASS